MTSHEIALEAALWKLHEREHAKLGEMLADKDEGSNWQGGKVNGITAALELVRNLSTLSPDVSGLVERLREMASVKTSALYSQRKYLSEAADALASLSLQLAAVEGERDKWLSVAHALSTSGMSRRRFTEIYGPKLGTIINNTTVKREESKRANDAEASLSAAQEENERLRKALDFEVPDESGQLLTLEETADLLIRAMNQNQQIVGYRSDLWTCLGECLAQRRATLSTPFSGGGELQYQCDACSTPGYGPDAKCRCTPSKEDKTDAE